MVMAVKIIGAVIAAAGVTFLIRPAAVKRFADLITQGKRVYIVGVIRIVLGSILIMSAAQCKAVWLVFILGLATFIAGGSIFLLGPEKCCVLMKKWTERPADFLRRLALIPVVIGVLLLLCA